MGYVDYELVGGPADGLEVSFPASFQAKSIELWHRGMGRPPNAPKDANRDFFALYKRDPETETYRYAGWALESAGADYSDEMYPDVYANVKGHGRLSVWCRQTELTS